MARHPHLQLVPPAAEDGPSEAAPPSGADLGLLALVFALHSAPLVALAAGHAWGLGTVGYATAVAIVSGGELLRELLACSRGRRESA